MATRKINQIHETEPSEPTAQDISQDIKTSIPDGFPPKGQYTAKAIANDLGFDPSGVEKYYFPEAQDIYQVCPQVLKAGHLFTQTFYDIVFLMRQHRMREKLMINAAGQIVRHTPKADGTKGKPVLEKNSDRMTAAQFKEWFWAQHPELIPGVAEDSVEALPADEVRTVKAEILVADDYYSEAYDEEVGDKAEANLTRVEQMGSALGTWQESMIQDARNMGKGLGVEMVTAMREGMEGELKEFMGKMKTTTKTTKKR